MFKIFIGLVVAPAFGQWVDMDNVNDISELKKVSKKVVNDYNSKYATHKTDLETCISDSEGYEGLNVTFDLVESVHSATEGMDDIQKQAYVLFLEHAYDDELPPEEAFHNSYEGIFKREYEFAYHYVQERCIFKDAESLESFFDFTKLQKHLFATDYISIKKKEGVFVFRK